MPQLVTFSYQTHTFLLALTDGEYEDLPEHLPEIEHDVEVSIKAVNEISKEEYFRLKRLLSHQSVDYLKVLENLPITASFDVVLVTETFARDVKIISKFFDRIQWTKEGLQVLFRSKKGIFEFLFVTGSECKYSDFYNVVDLADPESVKKAEKDHEDFGINQFLCVNEGGYFPLGLAMRNKEDGRKFVETFLKRMGCYDFVS